MAASEREILEAREIGEILHALKTGEQQRGEFRQSLSDARGEIAELREMVRDMFSDFKTTAKQASDAVTVAARVSLLEARLGSVVNDVQGMQSFLRLAKSYSVKAAFAVLISMVIGVSATTKVIEWIFSFIHSVK